MKVFMVPSQDMPKHMPKRTMSSSKRRKLEGELPPQSPVSAVSAVSAIAARRRQGVSAVQSQASSPELTTPNTNSFSALQSLKPNKSKGPTPLAKKSAKQACLRRNDGNRPSGSPTPLGESPAIDMSAIEIKSPVISPQPHNRSYSSFLLSKVKHRTMADGSLEVSLDAGERFIVLGSFGIRVVAGEVTVAGATLRSSEGIFWVQAPNCLAIPVIRTTQNCELQFHSDVNSVHLKKLGRLSPLLRRLWNEAAEADSSAGKSFRFINDSSDGPKRRVIHELVSPPEWNKLLASVEPTTRSGHQYSGFICGPKSAGKSTFARLLTNRLLTSYQEDSKAVIVLDLDPGQPEFAPPGTVSLIRVSRPNLGVPFTHTSFDDPGNTAVRCHTLAAVTPASSPDLFIACAVDLYEFYQRHHRKCPLIINTPGWILGTGLDLLVALITRMRPAEVIYMSEDGPADVIEALEAATKHKFSTLPSQPSEFMSRTCAHFRSMQMMSYFHSQVQPDNEAATTSSVKWASQPLSHTRPYVVRYDGENQDIMGILSYDCQTPPELLAASINGAVLAIVEIEESKAFQEVDKTISTFQGEAEKDVEICRTPEGLPFIVNSTDGTLDPRYSHTIGLALIRAVDTKNKSLQVITPLPTATLERIRSQGRNIVLVHGNFDSPHWAYTEDLYERAEQDDAADKDLDMSDGETSDDETEAEAVDCTAQAGRAYTSESSESRTVPWIETLSGNQKRPVGSRVWRVRRDLGRNNGD